MTELPATIEVNRDGGNSSVPEFLHVQVNEVLSNDEAQERYREEVEYLDDSLGVLLAAIRTAVPSEETIVILTSDHGEELGEHGSIGHVTRLYEPAIRVPLIISWPGRLPTGTVITEPVSHIDLLPTLVDLLAIQDSERRSGQSLQSLWNESAGTTFTAAPILVETFRPESPVDRKALVVDGFKLIETVQDASLELYDLENDPAESDNLVDQAPEIIAELSEALLEQVARAEDNARTSEEQTLTDEQMQRLRSLGYVR